MCDVNVIHIYDATHKEVSPMSTTEIYTPGAGRRSRGVGGWLREAEAWLDDKGKAAWIAAMVAGFIVFWPIGLGLLAYMIWSKRMFSKSCSTSHGRDRSRGMYDNARAALRPSGNSAFDAYKAETLRRLEEEQRAFEDFLGRLREAKDKAEFDAFMEDRARRAKAAGGSEGSDETPSAA
jgi:hypothetical protein